MTQQSPHPHPHPQTPARNAQPPQGRILVLGATGKTGSRVVTALRNRDVPVYVASRSPQGHVDGRYFDWQDRSTWAPALEGVTGVYIVPLDGVPATPDFVAQAVAANVQRIVLLSARGVDTPGYFGEADPANEARQDAERAVRTSGVTWTILQPGWFAQNFSEGQFRDEILTGELRLPVGASAATFVDVEDIAAVAAAALLDDGHAGRTYELSGPRALTVAEALAEITAATGRPSRYVAVDPAAYHAELVAAGLPEADAQSWIAALSAIHRGLEAKLSDGLERALGRSPRDFTDFVESANAAGAWTP
ncbi:NAD(P)H-binding protein [Streptomyces sp. SID3343]|uniref:NAD(P)H-binding protein n=1 Tax=Streptomyces sp. SID3343 TaxID=2690260 RepID=UPI00136D0AC3|nr:NAD(P)H-binding protein [Streptomyces sp. SID3343]MYW04046.1 NAD(P)H-binding protein [Streptomyces sp. SID3343]